MKNISLILLSLIGFASYGLTACPVILKEVKEDFSVRDLDSTRDHFLVDINSAIDIRINPDQYVEKEDPVIKAQIETLNLELSELVSALDSAREFPKIASQILILYQKLQMQSSAADDSTFERLVKRHGGIGTFIRGTLKALGTSKAKRDSVIRLEGSAYFKGLADLLVERIQSTEEKLNDLKKSTENENLYLKIWCIQYSSKHETTQIHLNNYDNLPEGNPQIIEKVTLNRTEGEEKMLKKSQEFYSTLISTYNEMQSQDSELKKTLNELLKQATNDLQEIKDLFSTNDLSEALTECINTIGKLQKTKEIELLINSIKTLQTKIEEFSNLKKLRDELFVTLQAGQGDPILLFNLIQQKIEEISVIRSNLDNLVTKDKISEIEKAIEETVLSLQNIQDEKIKEIASTLSTKYTSWKYQIEQLRTSFKLFTTLNEIANTVGLVQQTAKGLSNIATISKISAQELSLKTAPPTALDLTRTNREEKDSYDLHIQAYRKNGLTQIPVYNANYTFRAMKMGWYSKWTGGLQFALMDKTTDLIPATSVMWTLHHRNDDGISMLSNVVDFGFGISSCIMSKEGNIEYGAGATLTFFSDILQAGYGFNIQQNKGYYFFGVALLDLLQASHALGEKK
jgi:hypothetical protein